MWPAWADWRQGGYLLSSTVAKPEREDVLGLSATGFQRRDISLEPHVADSASVLIAEDDAAFRGLLGKIARRLGMRVTEAADGSEAKERIDEQEFDLLILDVVLPGHSGLQLLEIAKKKDPTVQGIVLTGNATLEGAIEALRLNAFDYLEKPLDSGERFGLILERALERRRLLMENKRLFEEVRRLAVRDPLTDLYNRRHMESVLDVELVRVRRYGRKLSTIMIDVDNLKGLNDRYGHPAGDKVLRRLAEVIRDNIRASDVPVRLGGDEFIVLLPETGIERAIGVAERIAEASRAIRCNGHPVYFSIGISEWGPGIESMEEFLEQTDQALYEAKNAGGRRIRAGDRMILAWESASV